MKITAMMNSAVKDEEEEEEETSNSKTEMVEVPMEAISLT